jgi:hypothetical protein
MSLKTNIGPSGQAKEAGFVTYTIQRTVTVGTAATQLLAAGEVLNLRAIILQNVGSVAVDVDLTGKGAVSGQGINLPAGLGFEMTTENGDMPTTAIYAISATAGQAVRVLGAV